MQRVLFVEQRLHSPAAVGIPHRQQPPAPHKSLSQPSCSSVPTRPLHLHAWPRSASPLVLSVRHIHPSSDVLPSASFANESKSSSGRSAQAIAAQSTSIRFANAISETLWQFEREHPEQGDIRSDTFAFHYVCFKTHLKWNLINISLLSEFPSFRPLEDLSHIYFSYFLESFSGFLIWPILLFIFPRHRVSNINSARDELALVWYLELHIFISSNLVFIPRISILGNAMQSSLSFGFPVTWTISSLFSAMFSWQVISPLLAAWCMQCNDAAHKQCIATILSLV